VAAEKPRDGPSSCIGSGASPEGRLQPRQRSGYGLGASAIKWLDERGLRRLPDSGTQRPQLVQPLGERWRRRIDCELGDGSVEGDEQLQRRLALAPGVEVETSPQDELFTYEWALSAAEQGSQPDLRPQHGRSAARGRRRRQLTRVAPASISDLLTIAVTEAGDDRLPAAGRVQVGVARGDPKDMQRPLEHLQPSHQLGLAGGPQPGGGGGGVAEGISHIDDRRPRRCDRCRRRLGHRGGPPPGAQTAALGRAERTEHEYVMGFGARLTLRT
jgi:hypothetical protein